MPINWTDGSWSSGAPAAPQKNIIIAADWAPIRHFAKVMAEEPEKCYGSTLELLDAADLRIVNLECALNGKKPTLKSGPNLMGTTAHIPCLKRGGFEIATLGNNHIFDYGREGFLSTRAVLDDLGMRGLGAGLNQEEARRPLIHEHDGLKIGFINFTEGHDLSDAVGDQPGVFGWHPDLACDQIRALKKQCHLVLAIVHAGVEYCAYPPRYCIETYRRLAAAGPTAVIAHHPHVPQGIEFYRGVPIFYSLGNYLFYQATKLYHRKHGYLLELSVNRDGLRGFKIHPYEISDDGVNLCRERKKAEFFELLARLSRPFGGDALDGFHGVLKERWQSGFAKAQFAEAMAHFDTDPPKAAAVLRSRLMTPQHTGLYIPMFDRVVRGVIDEAPDWATEMEHEYLTRQLPPVDARPSPCAG